MDAQRLFLESDAALRHVVQSLRAGDLQRPTPPEWTPGVEGPVLRDVLAAHAYDEAWVSDVLAGVSVADGDPWLGVDLLGDDPIAGHGVQHARATAAVESGVDPQTVLRFQYGEYSAAEGFLHLAVYRAFQAWSIARLVGRPVRLGPSLVGGFTDLVVPHAEEWRGYGVFPPSVEPPADADDEMRLLCTLGFLQP